MMMNTRTMGGDKANEGKGGLRGVSPDESNRNSVVALSKSTSAALSLGSAALTQLFMFSVMCMVWYQ